MYLTNIKFYMWRGFPEEKKMQTVYVAYNVSNITMLE